MFNLEKWILITMTSKKCINQTNLQNLNPWCSNKNMLALRAAYTYSRKWTVNDLMPFNILNAVIYYALAFFPPSDPTHRTMVYESGRVNVNSGSDTKLLNILIQQITYTAMIVLLVIFFDDWCLWGLRGLSVFLSFRVPVWQGTELLHFAQCMHKCSGHHIHFFVINYFSSDLYERFIWNKKNNKPIKQISVFLNASNLSIYVLYIRGFGFWNWGKH